jgi:acetoin utilization deacetylase AcuC-like enzyme
MKIIYDETHHLHAPVSEFSGSELTPYPECPDRAEGILAALRRSDWAEVVPPQVCAIEKLSSIHPSDYLRFLQQVHDSWLGTGQSGDLAPSIFCTTSSCSCADCTLCPGGLLWI